MTLTLRWPWPSLWHWPQTSQTDVQVVKLAFSMRWPWSNDLDTQTWPRYDQDVTPYQIFSFYVNWFKSYSLNRQTDTHTHRQPHRHDENITSTAYAGGNKDYILKAYLDTDRACQSLSFYALTCKLHNSASYMQNHVCGIPNNNLPKCLRQRANEAHSFRNKTRLHQC